jgi:hypothetical protein
MRLCDMTVSCIVYPYRPDILKSCQTCKADNIYFAFAHNNRTVTTTIVHFQVRAVAQVRDIKHTVVGIPSTQ